ncbi:protein CYPRO4-like [Amaranthus tricolor]|uniref:protein CYPRO4-like n=1 Tax=Amaranthus tricolor TaxID=29722 RepID=UPI0025840560|nr:protein CYPRO4-like [Amaranthus tricolor]
MGAANSREGLELSDSDDYDERDSDQEEDYDTSEEQVEDDHSRQPTTPSSSSLDDVEARLKALKLKYPVSSTPIQTLSSGLGRKNAVKLYRHVGGDTSDSKWKTADGCTSYLFVKSNDDEDEEEEEEEKNGYWELRVGSKIRVRVSTDLQLKMFPDQLRVDFVCNGVWALKFFEKNNYYSLFLAEFQDCLFENVHGLKATEKNKLKVYGKDFLGWLNPEDADDTMWDAVDDEQFGSGSKTPSSASTPSLLHRDLLEEIEEVANSGIQSLALGALDNSFLVGNDGIQVVKNFRHGIHGKGVCVKFDRSGSKNTNSSSYSTPKKAILMRGETNMMLMSPVLENKPHAPGLHQLDIETGKIVTEWKFAKDGADISMRDITNDNKGAQLDPSGSTFLGLDDNRLCQWDMRERCGMVQSLATSNSPVLHWNQGHQFSRGTNFQCFASTGDGSIVVGSLDGKIRLYSKTSMRQAKTAFPGLGSPITHVDVTYDGKWVLGTTDTYLILICTLFTDKDGRTKTGFGGRMGNRVSAPRLLKLTPVDAHRAGSNNKFHGGQFSWVTEEGKQERHIVVTAGKFSVIWNFEQVKNSGHECYQNQQGMKSCYCYKIVLKDESIVDSRFMHEKFAVSDTPEAPLVVATPMKVTSFSISTQQ